MTSMSGNTGGEFAMFVGLSIPGIAKAAAATRRHEGFECLGTTALELEHGAHEPSRNHREYFSCRYNGG